MTESNFPGTFYEMVHVSSHENEQFKLAHIQAKHLSCKGKDCETEETEGKSRVSAGLGRPCENLAGSTDLISK